MTEDDLKALEAKAYSNAREQLSYASLLSTADTDVPALIAEVRLLKRDVEVWKNLFESVARSETEWYQRAEKLRKVVEAAKKQLTMNRPSLIMLRAILGRWKP